MKHNRISNSNSGSSAQIRYPINSDKLTVIKTKTKYRITKLCHTAATTTTSMSMLLTMRKKSTIESILCYRIDIVDKVPNSINTNLSKNFCFVQKILLAPIRQYVFLLYNTLLSLLSLFVSCRSAHTIVFMRFFL